MKNHIFRKRICKNILSDISREDCYKLVLNDDIKSNIDVIEYKCKYCDNVFSARQSKWRHENICRMRDVKMSRIDELERKINELMNKTSVNVVNIINNTQIVINGFGNEKFGYKTKE